EEDDERGSGENQPRGDDGDRAEPERQDVVEQSAHRRGRIRQGGGDEDCHENRDAGRGELVPEAGATAGQQATGFDDPARAQDPKRADEADESEELDGSERESDPEDDEDRQADQPQVPLEPRDPVRGDDDEDERLPDEDEAGEEIDDPAG